MIRSRGLLSLMLDTVLRLLPSFASSNAAVVVVPSSEANAAAETSTAVSIHLDEPGGGSMGAGAGAAVAVPSGRKRPIPPLGPGRLARVVVVLDAMRGDCTHGTRVPGRICWVGVLWQFCGTVKVDMRLLFSP